MIKVQIHNVNIFTRILTNFRNKIVGRIIQGIYPHGHQYKKTLIVSDCSGDKILHGSSCHELIRCVVQYFISMSIYT